MLPVAALQVMQLDLSSLQSVRQFAASFRARGLPLHVLVNNAGIFAMSAARQATPDGFEAHLGTNHLGHFLLTLLLLPALRQGATQARRGRATSALLDTPPVSTRCGVAGAAGVAGLPNASRS